MPRSAPHCRRTRRRPTSMPPWHIAEYVWGLCLGLALAGMAIDYGRRTAAPSAPLPPAQTLTQFPGP